MEVKDGKIVVTADELKFVDGMVTALLSAYSFGSGGYSTTVGNAVQKANEVALLCLQERRARFYVA